MATNMRAFIHGLYDGDGTLPATPGAVFISGMSQATGELSVYQARLQDWYEDETFWNDMNAYVSDWSQELYGDVRNYAVPGADLPTRSASLDDYLQHELALARVAPATASAASSFLSAAYNPLANGAWQYDAAFGWTNVPYDLMQHYVSAQTNALRAAGPRFGFAWAPKNLNAMVSTDFTAQTDVILDRLAASIADADPCGGVWCGGDLDGAWLNTGWRTFAAWKPSQLAFTSAPQTVVAGAASQPLTIELRTNTGLAFTAGAPLAVTLSSTSQGGEFSTAADGQWSSTLMTTIPSGATTTSVYYRDSQAGSVDVTAAAAGKVSATQTETVNVPPADTTPPETTVLSAPSGTIASTSASISFASEADARFECSLDGAAFAACTSPATYDLLAQGPHTFDVRAIDAAGNVDASPASAAWTTDTVAPESTITTGPSGAVASTSASLSFASEPDARFECSLDGAAFTACASPTLYSGLAQGMHTFSVRAIDAAGNADASAATRTWTVDTIAPGTRLTQWSRPSWSSATFWFVSTESGARFECSLDYGAFAACSSPKTYWSLYRGTHTIRVRSIDAAGNVDASPAYFTWKI